jgi:mycothiol system anti-sigma-R factor
MNCRECLDYLYEYLDQELTAEVRARVREHLEDCEPCGEQADFERSFLKFIEARCRSRGAPPQLKRKILQDLFGE